TGYLFLAMRQVDQESELLQLHRQVDRDQADAGWQPQRRRREVQYTADAGGYQGVGRGLRGVGRDGNHTQFRRRLLHHFGKAVRSMNLQTVDGLANLAWIRIEQADEAEALLLESAITKQRPRQVADADNY